MGNIVETQVKPKPPTKADRCFRKFRKLLFSDLTQNPVDIAFKSYRCKNKKVAAVIASQCLKKLNLSMAELLDRQGLTDLVDIEELKRLRRAQDKTFVTLVDKEGNQTTKVHLVDNFPTQFKALKLTQQLKGRLMPGAPIVNIDNRVQYAKITVNDVKGKSRKDIVDIILGRTNANGTNISDT